MKKHILQEALEYLTDQGDIEGNVRSYSGRCMYGKKCLAISGRLNAVLIGFHLGRYKGGDDGYEEIEEYDLQGMRSDNMGLGVVYYWPRVPYVKNYKQDENEEDNS